MWVGNDSFLLLWRFRARSVSRKGVSMRRIVLTGLALCILLALLAVSSGAVNAQTREANTSRQASAILVAKVADDGGSNSVFYYLWGVGLCVNHSTLQYLENAGAGDGWTYAIAQVTKLVSFPEAVPIAVFYGALVYLLSQYDNGRGVCVVELPPIGGWFWSQ
jgi:hypothetical protein